MMTLLALQSVVTPDIIRLLVVIVVCGFCVWLVTTFVPMSPPFKNVLVAVIVLVLVLWVLRFFSLI